MILIVNHLWFAFTSHTLSLSLARSIARIISSFSFRFVLIRSLVLFLRVRLFRFLSIFVY